MKPLKVLAAIVVALVAIFGMLYAVVVPQSFKEMAAFEMKRAEATVASGTVEREPPGTRIFWAEFGKPDGPPVVVLHPAFGAIATMAVQIEALAPTHRVLAIDSRGHNQSTNTADKLTYEMMSDDVIAVMDARKIARADIVGWSDGGNIGIDMARRYPERVRKLVAFGAVYDNTGADEGTIAQMRKAKHDDPGLAGMRTAYEQNAPDPTQWPQLFRQVQTLLLTEPRWTREQLATIQAPVLLVNGATDIVRRAHAEELRDAMPNARLEIIERAGHEAPLARGDKVNAVMLPFLGSIQ